MIDKAIVLTNKGLFAVFLWVIERETSIHEKESGSIVLPIRGLLL
jgi:hypothetical protein